LVNFTCCIINSEGCPYRSLDSVAIHQWLLTQERPEFSNTTAIVAAKTTIQESENEQNSQLQVQPSQKSRDEQLSAKAQQLIIANRFNEAEQMLVEAVAENSDFHLSRKALFDLYAQLYDVEKAKLVLAQWNNISPAKKALLSARLAVQGQAWDEALLLLEQFANDAKKDVEYRALLAAVYHQNGQYKNATLQYQGLLDLDKPNSAYWLGLAVSQDALAEKAEALRAFRYARLYGGLDVKTGAYVEQRIQALSTTSSAG